MAGGQPAPVAPDDPHLRPRRRRRRLRAARRAASRRSASCCATPASTTPGPSVVRLPEPPAPPRARGPAARRRRRRRRFARGVLLPQLRRHARRRRRGERDRRLGARRRGARRRRDRDHRRRPRCWTSPDVDAVLIATRHDTHAAVRRARAARRQARVRREAARARRGGAGRRRGRARRRRRRPAWSGFNRRFAPLAVALREALGEPRAARDDLPRQRRPAAAVALDARPGGRRRPHRRRGLPLRRLLRLPGRRAAGRGAARWRSGAAPSRARTTSRRSCASRTGRSRPSSTPRFGDPSLPKERVEVLGEAGAGVLDDFRAPHAAPRRARDGARGAARQGPRTRSSQAFAEACRTGRAAVARRGHGRRDARDVRDPRRACASG